MRQDYKDWIAALRSGEHKQGKEALLNHNGEMCCLGVYAKLRGFPIQVSANDDTMHTNTEMYTIISGEISSDLDQHVLIGMNDRGKTFEEIADFIEEALEPKKEYEGEWWKTEEGETI